MARTTQRTKTPSRYLLLSAEPFHGASLTESDADLIFAPYKYRNVVELLDHALDVQPVDDVAALEVDHHDAAAGRDALGRQRLAEFEAGERLVLGAWTRQPDDGETVGEDEAAQITGTEGDRFEAPFRCRSTRPK